MNTQSLSILQNPSLLSFEQSTLTLLSSENSTASSSTIWGPGTLAGKALERFGQATLNGMTAIAIQMRLRALKTQFPHRDPGPVTLPTKSYQDMLELTRRGCYSPRVRKQALRLVLLQISHCRSHPRLLSHISNWPTVEISLFLRELMLSIPFEFTGLERFQQRIHSELMRDLEIISQLSIFRYVQFFAEVIIGLPDGAQAFIDADGLDVLYTMHSTTSTSEAFFDLCGHNRPPLWNWALEVLSHDARAAEHSLLAVLPNKYNFYCPVWSPVFGQFGETFPYRSSSMGHQLLHEYKVVILGSSNVGKSALVDQFIRKYFTKMYNPTIENLFRKDSIIDGEAVRINILDTSGQQEYSALREQYIREGNGFLLVYSITSKESFEELVTFHQQILNVKNWSFIPVVIVANNCDVQHKHEVNLIAGHAYAKTYGCKLIETSAKERVNVDEAFSSIVSEIRTSNKTF